MLTELRLQNFKPFATMQTVRLAPITLIYGPNSSGKSSLIQSLLLLKQTLEDGDHEPVLVARGPMTDLGSYEALIHGHDARLPLLLGIGQVETGARNNVIDVPTIPPVAIPSHPFSELGLKMQQ